MIERKSTTPTHRRAWKASVWWALILLALALLAAIPGYYSFDELQWLARGQSAPLPWSDWTAFGVAQYRPLTFDLWLGLSRLLGYHPWRWHLLWTAFAALNGGLLYRVARSYDIEVRTARWLALVFLFSPYAMFVHAWIGTLADLLVLLFALLAVLWLRRYRQVAGGHHRWADVAAVSVLMLLALASKESAVTVPALIAAAAYRHPQPRRVWIAFACSVMWVGVYLVLRAQTILFGAQVTAGYAWSVANIPANVLRYLLFPFDLGGFEVHVELLRWRTWTWLACAFAALLLWLAARTGWRWLLVLLLALALPGPVLILDLVGNQYAYLATAAVCVLLALMAGSMTPWGRRGMMLLATVACIHGTWLAVRMVSVARVQQNLYADLLPRLQAAPDKVWHVGTVRPGDAWLPTRLLHEVPSYQGVPMGDRVRVVAAAQPADLVMAHDGHLHAATTVPRVK